MTIPLLANLKQPSQFEFEWALQDKLIPFSVRARVINVYRKLQKQELFGKGPPHIEVEYSPKPRGKKKPLLEHRSRNSSWNNYLKSTVSKYKIAHTSGGRKRPSRKVKFFEWLYSSIKHLPGTRAAMERDDG